MKNPPWNRDELILALDLYFKLGSGQMDGRNLEVIKLSRILIAMNRNNGFVRTVNSVSLKLANFKRIDPDIKGKGMASGAKLDKKIWEEFLTDKTGLKKAAELLRTKIITEVIKNQKKKFIGWLTNVGKVDGSSYKKKTIETYATQIEYTIANEFSLSFEEDSGLYGVIDIEKLEKISDQIKQGVDNKRRRDLRSAFNGYVRFVKDTYTFNDSDDIRDEFESRTEGGQKVFLSRRVERDHGLRAKAILIHGTACKVCGFDFGKVYGEWGEGFIEVHHLIPLGGKNKKKRETDPTRDLTVLCANCHRMVHRKKKTTLTIEELKQKLKENLKDGSK